MNHTVSSRPKLLLMISGSIAAYKAASLVSRLKKAGYEIRVILTKSALEFVGTATFEGLGCDGVLVDLFSPGHSMAHIHWERWADLIAVYPATAHTIEKMANGAADDLLGTLFLAYEFKKPFLIFPAMNQGMWAHPATQSNVAKLRSWGISVCGPEYGAMACGEAGSGRVMEPELAELEIQKFLAERITNEGKSSNHTLSILVTAGATIEYIDPVRIISNVSSGTTGSQIAQGLHEEGHSVTLLLSQTASVVEPRVKKVIRFNTTDDLSGRIAEELSQVRYDLVIHCAAVSDFRPRQTNQAKIGTRNLGSDPLLKLELVPNRKVIQELYVFRDRNYGVWPKIISFKLTADSPIDLENYDSDWVVHNEWKDVSALNHRGMIFKKDISNKESTKGYRSVFSFVSKSELVNRISEIARGLGEINT